MRAMVLANTWDSGGQNYRFTQAARRHGGDLRALVIQDGQDIAGLGARWAISALHATYGQDTAGMSARFARASEGVEGLTIRAAHRQQTYLDYPYDILWTPGTEPEIRRLAEEADVIHLNDRTWSYTYFKLQVKDKPALLHHHGSAFRGGHKVLSAEARKYGMVEAVSTVDLLRFGGENLTWLPAPYNLDELALIRAANRREEDGRIRVVQTPTNRAVKSTEKLEAAVRALQDEGVPVDLVVGEKIPWRKALPLKATADIAFDQVGLGYGCSAVEAWGMGLPVIAGGDAWTEARMRVEYGSEDLPFYKAEDTVQGIYDSVRALALSADLRAEYAARGQAHARRFHDERVALGRLIELYLRAIETARLPRPRPATLDLMKYAQGPGDFRCIRYPALAFYSDGVRFKFVGGRLSAGPQDGPRVRAFMARPSSALYEITEGEPAPAPVAPTQKPPPGFEFAGSSPAEVRPVPALAPVSEPVAAAIDAIVAEARALDDLSYREVQQLAKAAGLSVFASKADLVAQLRGT